MKPLSVSTASDLLLEMVDDAMGELASQKGDLRAAVAEARRVADLLHGQGATRDTPKPQAPAWPVEPGSLAEAVYWYRCTAGLGDAPTPAEVAGSLSNLGYAWRQQRRWAEAEAAFRESLRLREQHGDRAGLGQTYLDLGSLCQAQQRWGDAEPALARALDIAREIGDRRGEASARGNLGVVCAALGQPDKAVVHFQQAVALARQIGNEALARRMQEHLARLTGSAR